jgi:hypothetical protein
MTFRKAERTQARLKIALTGPSGSGKTFSGLLIAAGIGKRIAVVDTENKSASLYAGMDKGPLAGLEFDILEIDAPYTIAKYLEAIETAEKSGYDVLIVDSISHAWAGEGGLLDKKTALDARGGNSYTNWATITPEQERFKARILQADMHVICTMRSKQDYVLELNDKGKSAPKKVGLAPIQRDGMEYEFTTVLDMAMDHNCVASKDRTSLFDGQVFKPSKDTGARIMKWLKAAKPVEKPAAAQAAPPAPAAEKPPAGDFPGEAGPAGQGPAQPLTAAQREKILRGIKALHDLNRKDETIWKGITAHLMKAHGREVAELDVMTEAEAETALAYLASWAEHVKAEAAKAAAAGRA